MNEKISMVLQTPPDELGERKAIHLVTSSDEVIVFKNPSESITLTDKLNQLEGIQIMNSQPDFPCIWARPID